MGVIGEPEMDEIGEPESSHLPCTPNELHIDPATDYCARWLATVPAPQYDETSLFVQEHSLSECLPKDSSPNSLGSFHAICASSHRTTHHRETPAVPHATPSSAPSRIDATPEPAPEYHIKVPYSPARPDEPSKYERKPRRKTRPDRYDTSHQHRERRTLSRRERREEKRKELRLRKEVVANFYCSATENRQVLVIRPPLAGGTMIYTRLTQRIDETCVGDRGFRERSRLRFNSAWVQRGLNSLDFVNTAVVTDLTFNELTFPITQKAAPRAASPQLPNGARKRPGLQKITPPEQIHQASADARSVIEGCSEAPTPQPGQRRGERPRQRRRPSNASISDKVPKEDDNPRNATTRPIIRYVDSGVDTMSHVGTVAPDSSRDKLHVELPAGAFDKTGEANSHVSYYNPPPVYMPQYYGMSYSNTGIHPQVGLQPGLDSAEHVPSHCQSQHVDSIPMQPEWSIYEHQSRDFSCMAPMPDIYDEYAYPSPVHELEPLYRPDEETKAFWRPNFLR
ncbi:hypothetical protein G3M48_000397 [Beauveria asiatica]|uniref:Uncharacterized protein n=1 Tax=Beauveria asiatica TaxID=1069075 RepID=A0AAW0RGU5_9HYPO